MLCLDQIPPVPLNTAVWALVHTLSLSLSLAHSHTHAHTQNAHIHTYASTINYHTLLQLLHTCYFHSSFLLFRSGFQNTLCLEGICINIQFHEHDESLFNCSEVSLKISTVQFFFPPPLPAFYGMLVDVCACPCGCVCRCVL